MENHKLDLKYILEGSCIKHLLPKNQLFELINVPGAGNINIDIQNYNGLENSLAVDNLNNNSDINEEILEDLKKELLTYNHNAIKFEHFETEKDFIFDKKELGLSKVAEFLLPNELLSQEKIQTLKQDSNKRKRDDTESFEVKKVVIKSKIERDFKDSYDYNYKLLNETNGDVLSTIHKELISILGNIDNINSSIINQMLYFVDILIKKETPNNEINEVLRKIVDGLKQDNYDINMCNNMFLIIKILILTTNKILNFEYLDNIFIFISEYSQDIGTEENMENIIKFSELLSNLQILLTPNLIIDSWDLNRIILSLQYILDYGTNNYNLNFPKFNKAIEKIKKSTTNILKMIFGKYPLQRDLILDLIMISFDKIPTLKEDTKFIGIKNTSITYFTYNIIQMLSNVAVGLDFEESLPGILEKSKLHELEMLSYGVMLTDLIIEKIINNISLKGKLMVYSKDLVKSIEYVNDVVPDYLLSSLINKLINIMDNSSMGNVSLSVLSELGSFIIKGKDKLKKDEYFEHLLNDNFILLKEDLKQFNATVDNNYLLKKYNFINELKDYMSKNEYELFNKQIHNDFELLINAELKGDLVRNDKNDYKLSNNHLNSLNYYEIYIKVLLETINNPKLQLGALKNFSILINQNKGLINTKFIKDLILKILKEDKVIIKEVILNFIKQDIKYIELFINEIEFNVLNDSLNIRKTVLSINKTIFEQSINEKLKFYGLKGIFKLIDDDNSMVKNEVKAYLYENVFEPLLDEIDEVLLRFLIKLVNEDDTIVPQFKNIMMTKDLIKMFKNINHDLIYSIIVYNQNDDKVQLNSNIAFINNLLQNHSNIINKQDLIVLIPLLNLNNADLKLRLNIFKIFATNLAMIKTDVKIKNAINSILLNDLLKYQLNELEHLIIIITYINSKDSLIKLYESLVVTLANSENDNKLKKLIVAIVSFIIHSNMVITSDSITNKLVMIFNINKNMLVKSIIINQLLKLCNKTPNLYSNSKILSLLDNTLQLNNTFNILKKEIVIGLTNYMKIQESNNDDIALNLIVKYTPKILIMVVHNNESMNNTIYKYIKNLVFFKIINPMIYLPYIVPLVIYENYHIKTLDLEFNDINILNKGTNLMLKSFTMNDDIKNLKYYNFIDNLLLLDVDINLILKIFIKLLRVNYKNKEELIFLTLNILTIVHKFNKNVIIELINITNILLDKLEQEENDSLNIPYRVLKIFLKHLNYQSNNVNFVNFKMENYDFEGLK